MRYTKLTKIVLVSVVFGVAACAELRRLHQRDAANTWTLVIAGEPVDEAIGGRSLDEILKDRDSSIGQAVGQLSEELKAEGIDLETDAGKQAIQEQLRRLADGTASAEEVVPQLRGIEGFSTALFLRSLFGEGVEVTGQIRDYIFIIDSARGEAGNGLKRTGSGHLAVDMTTRFYKSGVLDRREFLHWDIEVLENGYTVHERQGSPDDPRDPFPDIPDLEFPEPALDPDNRRSIWARGLTLKLYARGAKAIRIRDVYRQIDDGPIARLPSTDARYEMTERSCIDLLTKSFPPGTTPPGDNPPKNPTELFDAEGDFCLGRCLDPFIVNTGGD